MVLIAGLFVGNHSHDISGLMGRLKALPSRIGVLPQRVARAPLGETAAEKSRRRDDENRWRKFYKTARWQALRLEVLDRDGWMCRKTGVPLVGKHPAPNSPVVDHIEPHRGDEALFWDPANLQAVSKAYHDSEKQRIEASYAFP